MTSMEEFYIEDLVQKGEKGDQGLVGRQGPQGIPGEKGDKGDPGESIEGPAGKDSTVPGPPGKDGIDGKDGKEGPAGPRGPLGPRGEKGEKGDQGLDGIDGKTGKDGEKGPRGTKGDKGDKGDTGSKGDTGPEGPKGNKGEQGEKPVLGVDYFIRVGGGGNRVDVSGFIPYTGATKDVDLGNYELYSDGIHIDGATIDPPKGAGLTMAYWPGGWPGGALIASMDWDTLTDKPLIITGSEIDIEGNTLINIGADTIDLDAGTSIELDAPSVTSPGTIHAETLEGKVIGVVGPEGDGLVSITLTGNHTATVEVPHTSGTLALTSQLERYNNNILMETGDSLLTEAGYYIIL